VEAVTSLSFGLVRVKHRLVCPCLIVFRGVRRLLRRLGRLAWYCDPSDEAVRRLSVTDELTGVYNGRHFRARLHEEIERAKRSGRPLALLVIDSDSLKMVNDQFGHDAGNRHLISIAQCVQLHVRASDVVARFGGDEFLVLQPDAPIDAAAAVAERIRVAIAAASVTAADGSTVTGTVSIGVAGFPRSAMDEDSLFRLADAALYDAKRHGKDRVFIAPATT